MKALIRTVCGEHLEDIRCCLCGEENRDNLIIESIGIVVGMSGDDFSFCKKCWNSRTLGKKILKLLEYPNGLKLKDEFFANAGKIKKQGD
jgi:hypothetical protein